MSENGHYQQVLPAFVLGFGDIAVIRSIIRGYLAYARRTIPPSQQREIQYHLLEGLYMRLAEMRPDAQEARLILIVSEIRALDSALLGFCGFVRQKVSPSRERDETLQDVERFRVQLAQMLPTRQG